VTSRDGEVGSLVDGGVVDGRARGLAAALRACDVDCNIASAFDGHGKVDCRGCREDGGNGGAAGVRGPGRVRECVEEGVKLAELTQCLRIRRKQDRGGQLLPGCAS